MKAAAIVLVIALVLAHPAVAITVSAAELAGVGVLGFMIYRAARRWPHLHRRTA